MTKVLEAACERGRAWLNVRSSCHVDAWLSMEIAAFVFAPWRIDDISPTLQPIVDVLHRMASRDNARQRDDLWRTSLLRGSAGYGQYDSVMAHVWTCHQMAGTNTSLPTRILRSRTHSTSGPASAYIVRTDHDRATTTTADLLCGRCDHKWVHTNVMPSITVSGVWFDLKNNRHTCESLQEAVMRCIFQPNSTLKHCPECQRTRGQNSPSATREIKSITLPAILV
jgi:hypothetical protein